MTPEEITKALNAMLEQGNQLFASELVPVLKESTNAGAITEAITAEETARKAADATLQSNIDKKVSKDDENWLEKFMPKIVLNKNGSVKSVTVGDNATADYSTINTRLSHYGGVVTPFDNESVYGRVVQVLEGEGNNLKALYVTAIFNNGPELSVEFANSIYEIVLFFGADGTFDSGTYEVKPISEVFYITLDVSHVSYEYYINKTYDDFVNFYDKAISPIPLIILGDSHTGAYFFLTKYYVDVYGSSNDHQYIFQLSFISVKESQLVGFYIVVEKDKTTVTPFEFQAQTKEEVEAAAKKLNELENSVTQVQNNFQGLAEYLLPVILNYNGLGDNNEPLFVSRDGAALTRAQICALLKDRNANQIVLENNSATALQTSTAKFLQCDGVNAFIIGFEGANAAGQVFDILYKWDETSAKVLRAELLYNPTA